MSGARPYPLDVHELRKGDWISSEKCEAIIKIPRTDHRYSLRLMDLQRTIRRLWAREKDNEVITTRSEKGGIRICDDNSSVETNASRFDGRVRGARRDTYRLAHADRSQMTPEMQQKQERRLVHQQAFLSAGSRGSRVALKAHDRQTPGLAEARRLDEPERVEPQPVKRQTPGLESIPGEKKDGNK